MSKTIAENIKKLRKLYNLSQKDLADIAGVTDKAVSRKLLLSSIKF